MGGEKILWKIQSLWEGFFDDSIFYKDTIFNDILSQYYKNNISIYNKDFYFVDKLDFSKSKKIVHSDDYGEYYGLKKSQCFLSHGKLIYLFDNHNKIIQPFLEYFFITEQAFDVVHIDAHKDDAIFPKKYIQSFSLDDVQQYIKNTRISDFFDFLSRGNLIKNIFRYTLSTDFSFFNKPKNDYLLSLDIDIFGKEGDFVDLESKIKIIAEAWKGASIVCIAMSPGFINQDYAKEIVKIFVNY